MKKEQLINYWLSQRIVTDKRIIKAFRKTKREDFVLSKFRKLAYDDDTLPTYEKQTISQPTTIVEILGLSEIKENHKVLEIGAGSGYNAALISKLAKKVYTIERKLRLADFARRNLAEAGIKNVEVICGDGSKGYPKEAHYDRIIATCACDKIPKAWKDQLKNNGIIVAPVGRHRECSIVRIRKARGKFYRQDNPGYWFVPLIKN